MRLADLPPREDVFAGRIRLLDVARSVDRADLARLLAEAFDAMDAMLADATDADVVFIPLDPAATDPADGRGWTAGHVVTHVTAGLEETSAAASTLARGAPAEGRPRYEAPWESLTTADAVRRRLAESRRMCQAFLETWPDEPHLDNVLTPIPPLGPLNAPAVLLLSLGHATSHLPQLGEALRQARVEGAVTG